jgi:predicted Fe-Mo cluster-binding NifX family protein
MKIAFPIQENEGLEGTLADHFGRAPKFVIYDAEKDETHTIDNTGDHFGGQISTPVLLSKNHIDILICRGLGRRAIARFADLGINIFITQFQIVKQALDAYKKNELTPATDADGCAGRHGE